MAGRRNNLKMYKRRRRRWKPLFLFLLVTATVLGFGYIYRDYLFAYIEAPADAPAGDDTTTEPPDTGGEEPEPDPENEEPPGSEPPPTVLRENWIHIDDGDNHLALVTKETYLGRYEPIDLVRVPTEMSFDGRAFQLRREARDQLVLMWQAARADGVNLLVASAYRCYDTQTWLFNDYAARHGEENANKFSARPGQSEHQLGTAVDFGGTRYDWKSEFGETDQGLWLAENAWRFGFAMSYPENSTHITGYIYEPWHFRYIGVEAAAGWKASGLVLSEFLRGQA